MNCSLLNMLRQGGYILYVRHGEATAGEDRPDLDFRNCTTQRNLSDNGRREAITYGQFLRKLMIPIQFPVLTSPYCRTVETAQLAFGRPNILVDPFWFQANRLNENLSAEEKRNILDTLQYRLAELPLYGNQVIIAHGFP